MRIDFLYQRVKIHFKVVVIKEKADALVTYVGKFREKIIYKIIVYDQLSLSNPRKRALKKKKKN